MLLRPPFNWALRGLHPLDPTIVTLPAVMLDFVPAGVAALTLLGLAYALRRPLRFGLAPLSLVALYRMYYAAKSGFYELFRYLTIALPFALLFALFGFREVTAIIERRGLPPRARAAAAFGIAILCLVLPLPGAVQLLIPGPAKIALGEILLGRDTQREVRYLLELSERHPDCVFVTRTASQAIDRGPLPIAYNAVVFGGPIGGAFVEPEGGRTPAAIAAARAPAARCVLFYRSLDCNLARGDGCEAALSGLAPVEELRFGSLPYNAPERGHPGPVVTLGAYRVR
jgi:hypothetical protein